MTKERANELTKNQLRDIIKMKADNESRLFDLIDDYKKRREVSTVMMLALTMVGWLGYLLGLRSHIVASIYVVFFLYLILFQVRNVLHVRQKHKLLSRIYGKE